MPKLCAKTCFFQTIDRHNSAAHLAAKRSHKRRGKHSAFRSTAPARHKIKFARHHGDCGHQVTVRQKGKITDR